MIKTINVLSNHKSQYVHNCGVKPFLRTPCAAGGGAGRRVRVHCIVQVPAHVVAQLERVLEAERPVQLETILVGEKR